MMKKALSVLMILSLSPLLSGCIALIAMEGLNDVTACSPAEFKQAQMFESVEPYLTPGQPLYHVQGMLGQPTHYSREVARNGDVLDVLFYPTQVQSCRDVGGKNEVTPIVFNRGQLMGYGNTYYHQVVASRL